MRKSLVALLLVLGAAALSANLVLAATYDDVNPTTEGLKLVNAQMVKELTSRASRLGASTGNNDTLWVGYTPANVRPAGTGGYWSIYAGFGKDGYNRPINGVPHRGIWDWETPLNGDSLQGWWPLLNLYGSAGGQTRTDKNRPWWCLDFGNMANYRINEGNGRTNGVVGVWHRDRGLGQPAPAGLTTPNFNVPSGLFAAWMGLRAHGDVSYSDPETGNPFNEDVLTYTLFGSTDGRGSDNGFPGYGSQMDQMLYRDISFAGKKTADLTVRFKFQTSMLTGFGTAAASRSGWFDSDPLGTVSGAGTLQPNNFISSSDAGDNFAPRDSFMVYIGSGVDGNDWLPAASNYAQGLDPQPVYDPRRRWFGEVLHWDRDPNSPDPGNPRPLYYRELLSVAGTWPVNKVLTPDGFVDTTFVIPNAVLQPFLAKNNKIRLVFRVKTNRGFDDQTANASSANKGAAIVDRVSYKLDGNPEVIFGDFENASDINNNPAVSAVSAWKSTGKPPGIFHHVHALADLTYEDLCGQKGDISRQCNMSGIVISAGDHDNSERAGGLFEGTAQRERNDGIMSPTIQLVGPYTINGRNIHGFLPFTTGVPGDIDASEDYYVFYDIFAGIMDPGSKGNLWRYAAQSYPSVSKVAKGSYPTWGNMRFPGFIIFNPDPQCLQDIEPLGSQALIKTSNANGIPDSIRIFVGKTQQCFRFGVSAGCAPTDGCYWDNVSFTLIDGLPAQLTADIWQWYNDAFPANEQAGLPGTANFDTAAAHVMTGLNIAQTQLNNLRADVPGDSVAITSSPTTARVDMVWRILPGPGNYNPTGRPDLGTIKRRPDNPAVVTKGDLSFWDSYRQIPGDFASPNAIVRHHNALGGWDPEIWNSARCDTAEVNLFAFQSKNVPGGPGDPTVWMSTYHESDPHYNILGIVKNKCFIRCETCLVTDIICDGTVPTYISSRPEHLGVVGTTREGTKIIPDGLLTPGAHVEYFFRDQKDTKTPGPPSGFCPDTNVVLQVPTEGSTDGHRWQEFGVLPNFWKRANFFHPVLREFGTGPACLLVVDNNDRRGNERVWMSVADTIGAVPQRYWGAHNGWHAIGAGGDLDNPADNRRGQDNAPGYVSSHLGQAGTGTLWDMFQIKASESLTTSAGSLGSKLANRTGTAGQAILFAKSSRQGPTPAMLNVYYTMMLYLTGDLNSGILGPYTARSQNDAGILMAWLSAGNQSLQNRGFWAVGDGFAESNIFGEKQITIDLMLNYLGTDLLHNNYIQFTGNTDDFSILRLFPAWQNKGPTQVQIFGMRNLCLWTQDVLTPGGVGLPNLAVVTSEYDRANVAGAHCKPGAPAPAPAGVFKDWSPSSPYKTLVDGWDLEHITNPNCDVNTQDRNGYFYKIFTNVWAKLCDVTIGNPIISLDVPNVSDGDLVNFVNMSNNPLQSGEATINFGLKQTDRVSIKVFDVSGRLVRTLADRQFAAGPHSLKWDGVDNAGRQVARGVYFTQVQYAKSSFTANKKLTVLK